MTTDNSVPVQREDEQTSAPHSTPGPRPTRYPFRAAAPNYAKAGLPIFRLARLTKKPLKGSRSFYDATTDPEIIEGWIEETPAANVALRTGLASGVLALDKDPDAGGEEALARLEAEIGPLPETRTHRTPRGGRHLLYRIPEGEGPVKCSARDGLDVRGDGGLLVMPPSVTPNGAYEVEKRIGMADATPELLRWARERGGLSRPRKEGRAGRTVVPDGEKIPEGSRNDVLTRICGRLHDGTRDLPRLIEDLMSVNEERCDPPLPYQEVEKTARSIHAKTPCKPKKAEDPELDEVLRKSSGYFYENLLKGGGKSKKRDVGRAAHIAAAKRRKLITLEIDGEKRRAAVFSDSYRQLAEEANTSAMSVFRNLRALRAEGVVVMVEEAVGERSATWALLEPAQGCYTPVNSPSLGRAVVGGVTLVRACDLETPMYGWRDPVGNAGGGVEVALEACPMQTTEELAAMLGVSRPRDLERRHLRRLVELGVLEETDGRWARPADHRENAARLRNEPYATVRRRRVRTRTGEGRTVVELQESVVVASPAERARSRRERHDKERALFRERRRLAGVEGDDACCELLNAWDDERDGLIPEVNWPEVVDGVIVHHDECGCSWCELDLSRPPAGLGGVVMPE